MPIIGCDYCNGNHGDLFLCPPAKAVLDALKQRGMDMTMPTVEFPELVPAPGADYLLLRQLTVDAALAPVGGVKFPAIVLSGQDHAGKPLPKWLWPGSAGDLRQTCRLVQRMTEMAIKKARG